MRGSSWEKSKFPLGSEITDELLFIGLILPHVALTWGLQIALLMSEELSFLQQAAWLVKVEGCPVRNTSHLSRRGTWWHQKSLGIRRPFHTAMHAAPICLLNLPAFFGVYLIFVNPTLGDSATERETDLVYYTAKQGTTPLKKKKRENVN